MRFTVRYNHRYPQGPQVPAFSHAGPNWALGWVTYAEEHPVGCGLTTNDCWPASVHVVPAEGGRERYTGPDAQGVYPRHPRSGAVLVRMSTDPVRYERRLPDHSVEVYEQPDGGLPGQRRVFLTERRDAHGQALAFTWDAQARLVAVTDALGQVTTLAYADAADPLRVTGVTDPFGRTATLAYTAAGQLATLTDTLGLTSTLVYEADDFVSALRTPYGTTTFRHERDHASFVNDPLIEAIDPTGGVAHLAYHYASPGWPESVPAAEVPPGFAAHNTNLSAWNTVSWDAAAWAAGPGDVATATVTHWLIQAWAPGQTRWAVGVPHSVQRPGLARVWYAYAGQTDPLVLGPSSQVVREGRVLENGVSQVTTATVNAQDRLTSRTDAVGRTTTYTYAANGEDLLEVRQLRSGGSDLVAQYGGYTAAHQPQTVTDAAGQTTTLTYTAAGQVLTATNAANETTTSVYDADGRLTSVTGAVPGATTTYTYDAYGRLRTVMGPDGYGVTTDYDVFDRPTRVTYPDGTYEETTYDRLHVATQRDRLGRVTRYGVDGAQRRVWTRDPAGRTVTQRWGPGGLAQLVDAKGQTTTWERDVQGRVTREVRADGLTATVYTYQPRSGRLATVTDPTQQVTTYTYGLDEAVSAITFSNATVPTPGVSYTHDPVYPRVTAMTDGTGTTTYTYHPAGQLGAGQVASVDGPLPSDTITYTYDALGRVAARALNGTANTLTQAYDALGRVTTETSVLGTFAYGYVGATGRLASVMYPNGQTSSYAYAPVAQDLRLQTIHHQRPGGATLSRFDYTYDVVGNILTWQQQADAAAPTVWRYGYDAADQLTSAVHQTTAPTPALLARYGYAYDLAGNRTIEQIDDAVTQTTHDALNRLVTQAPGGVLRFAGTVSEPASVTVQGQPASVTAAGQFVVGVPVASGTNTVTIAAADPSGNTATAVFEVDQAGAAKSFTYDANGNLTSDGTRSFEWDARNQLVAVTVGTRRSEFSYDGLQRRVRQIEKDNGVTTADTRVRWCETAICEERAADGVTVTRRAFGLGEQIAGVARYFTADHLGSVREVTDTAGTLLARYAFDPWGRRTVTAGTDITTVGFTGHRTHTNSALALTLYRGYDAGLARWVSSDPLGDVDGPNRYAYVTNTPLRVVDPDGRFAGAIALPWIVAPPVAVVVTVVITAVIVYEYINDDCERRRCEQVKRECHEKCWEEYQEGRHRDIHVYFRCMTNCLNAAGCGNYGGPSW